MQTRWPWTRTSWCGYRRADQPGTWEWIQGGERHGGRWFRGLRTGKPAAVDPGGRASMSCRIHQPPELDKQHVALGNDTLG